MPQQLGYEGPQAEGPSRDLRRFVWLDLGNLYFQHFVLIRFGESAVGNAARRCVAFRDKELAPIAAQHERYTDSAVSGAPESEARRILVNDLRLAKRTRAASQTERGGCEPQRSGIDWRRETLKEETTLEGNAQHIAKACESPCEICDLDRRVR